ncbi:MAG: site-2 protease family protein [Methanocellales archaeon]|nr:site-2 protease family protein [Methanocellales archaeon]MDD3421111.1 site-2 protease family protein [Methanocellales archaeon]MDD4898369.1 site-2 protease family protein [Methanocellales archaeon]MDD5446729.1 site-2 protease family protein [Methanocellales archaeon]
MHIDFLSPWILIPIVLIGWGVLIALNKRGLLPQKFEVSGPMLLWRTDHGKDGIAYIAHRFRPFWKKTGILCIVVSTITMIFTSIYIIATVILLIKYPQTIPTDVAARETILFPGLALPITYGFVALIIAIIVHEFSHGIFSVTEGMKIKSLGIAVLAILPAAFVEPDEEDIKKATSKSRMKMFSAGPTANILVFIISLLVFTYVLLPFFAPSVEGVGIAETVEGFPAKEAGMSKGEIITHVDETRVKYVGDFQEEMMKHKPGDDVVIKTDRKVYSLDLESDPDDPSKAFLGVSLFPVTEGYGALKEPIGFILPQVGGMLAPILGSGFYGADLAHPGYMLMILQLVFWTGLLNFWLGALNLLPAKPFDGGRLMEEYIRALAKKNVELISNAISALFISLYVGSFLAIVLYGGL